jgi:tetratricopeptide (TPR) repeat protein
VRSVLSWSYGRLTPDAARAFRLIGVHPSSELSVSAAAALLDVAPERCRTTLDQLARAHLLQRSGPSRYGLHDLLRVYAIELAATVDSEAERRAAAGRLLDHYLHTAHAADCQLEPRRHPIALPVAGPSARGASFAGAAEALAWFTAERAVLLDAVGWAARSGFDTHAWQLAWTLSTFLERRGFWPDFLRIQEVALAATQRLADRSGQAWVHRLLARANEYLGRLAESWSHQERALDLFEQLDDLDGQARTQLGLSVVAEQLGRIDEALKHDQRAYDLFVDLGDRYGQALALNQLGCDHLVLGDHERALGECGRALALLEEAGDLSGQAATLDSLGTAYQGAGRYAEAIRCYQRAIVLYRQLGNRWSEADTLTRLGGSHDAAGEPEGARAAWRRAVQLLEELDLTRAAQLRAKLTDALSQSVLTRPSAD